MRFMSFEMRNGNVAVFGMIPAIPNDPETNAAPNDVVLLQNKF